MTLHIVVGGDGFALDWCHHCGMHAEYYCRPAPGLTQEETRYMANRIAVEIVKMEARSLQQQAKT